MYVPVLALDGHGGVIDRSGLLDRAFSYDLDGASIGLFRQGEEIDREDL
ncbi:MAG: hypothetical protein JNL98_01200 [Bryobacterales bacterium]|nr:hypothetical protein [Bryobacterales bacterium]